MKKLLTLFFIPLALWANPKTPVEILKASAEAYHKIETAQVDFSQSATSELTGETQTVSGTLWVGKKDAFKLELKGFMLISDGINLFEYREATSQVLIKSLLDLDRAFHPSQVLFKYLTCEALSLDEVQVDKKISWHLRLDPKGKIKGVEELEVWLDTKTLYPVQIKTVDVVGNTSLYQIQNFKNLSNSSSDLFEWKDIEGVEVLDMR